MSSRRWRYAPAWKNTGTLSLSKNNRALPVFPATNRGSLDLAGNCPANRNRQAARVICFYWLIARNDKGAMNRQQTLNPRTLVVAR
jgi:hypothetical protein